MKRTIKTADLWRMRRIIGRHRSRRFMRKIDRFNTAPSVCWLDLVCWDAVDHGKPLARLLDLGTSTVCKQEATRCGTCYCGKFSTQAAADERRAEFNDKYQPFIVEVV